MSSAELEVKAVVADPQQVRARILAAEAISVFQGRMSDRRYDRDGELQGRDEVLRVRSYHRTDGGVDAILGWKGPVRRSPEGYKLRNEIELPVAAPASAPEALLGALGYRVVHAVDRYVEIYRLSDAILRLEQYPRMDVLLEIEGSPEGIERAAAATGIPRTEFSAESLVDFVRRYEARTGVTAQLALDSEEVPASWMRS